MTRCTCQFPRVLAQSRPFEATVKREGTYLGDPTSVKVTLTRDVITDEFGRIYPQGRTIPYSSALSDPSTVASASTK